VEAARIGRLEEVPPDRLADRAAKPAPRETRHEVIRRGLDPIEPAPFHRRKDRLPFVARARSGHYILASPCRPTSDAAAPVAKRAGPSLTAREVRDQDGRLTMDPQQAFSRPRVEALDAILGQSLPVLDQGFVRVVDYMGSDAAIVQAARVSYGEGTKQVHEDRGLIRYLMRHRHTTPFEMCEIKLHVRVPMDCWRQWIRHRSASTNEYSTRYSVAIDAAQVTAPDEWRLQAAGNRQGSGDALAPAVGESLSRSEAGLHRLARRVYEERLDAGVAREQARKDLPLATYTEAYWKIDLHNLLHFLALRIDDHAQLEIRKYARLIGHEIVARWCPLAWEAFCDYQLNALQLSALEVEVVQALNAGKPEAAIRVAAAAGLLSRGPEALKRNRERSELEQKLRKLKLRIPWKEDARSAGVPAEAETAAQRSS
jgi:thymidylate synthase (FAD)